MGEITRPNIEKWVNNNRPKEDVSHTTKKTLPVVSITEYKNVLRLKNLTEKAQEPEKPKIDIRLHPEPSYIKRLENKKKIKQRQILKQRLKESWFIYND